MLEYVAYATPVPSAPPVVVNIPPAPANRITWVWPGFYQWTIPSNVYQISVSLAGGSGGADFGSSYFVGGDGGELKNVLMNVTPGEVLNIYVASNGGLGNAGSPGSGGYGFASGATACDGGGGGSSAVVNSANGMGVMAPGGGGSQQGCWGGGGGGLTDGYFTTGGNGGGGNGGSGGNYIGGNGGFPGFQGYNSTDLSVSSYPYIPSPGYPFVEIQWN